MNEEAAIKARKEKLSQWLSNPWRVLLIVILIAAFILRMYLFVATYDQPVWYDEADYMATAKSWALGIPYAYNAHRPPLFPAIGAVLFFIGLPEGIVKFLLVFLPSFALIFLTYLLGKEMYNEKVGVIAALFMAVNWSILFWTMRYQPDFLSMCFQVAAILFAWKYWKSPNPKAKHMILVGVFAALGFHFKISGLLVPIGLAIFAIIKDRSDAFKNKHYYYSIGAFILVLLPYFIWSYFTLGNAFAFSGGYSVAIEQAMPFKWSVLTFFYNITDNITIFLFIIGLIISFKFLLYADVIAKDKKVAFDPNILSIIMLIVVSAFYIFYIRSIEDRWVFLWLPFIFFLVGQASLTIYHYIKPYQKQVAILVVLFLLISAAYFEYAQGRNTINARKDSTIQVKEAAIWMKDNSNPGDKLMAMPWPQTQFYAERQTNHYGDMQNETVFYAYLHENKPRYIEFTIFEPNHPQWAFVSGNYPSGALQYLAIPFLNSSVVFTEQGQIQAVGLEQQTVRDGITFKYAYPKDTVNGVFIYEMEYS